MRNLTQQELLRPTGHYRPISIEKHGTCDFRSDNVMFIKKIEIIDFILAFFRKKVYTNYDKIMWGER